MDKKKPEIITIASIKGGVGKSTSAIIFATLLAKQYKVLLIDIDTQASTTSYYHDKLIKGNINIVNTNIYKVLNETLDINDSIVNIRDNLDFIPSYIHLHKFVRESIPLKELRLKECLFFLKKKYDYIISDTNPSLDSTLANALICSNYIIVPMTAEKWAVESLELIEFYMKELRLKLPIFILITRFKKNNTHKELLEYIQSKKGFLGFIYEREDLNKRISKNDIFDLNRDYIRNYEIALDNFLHKK
ncbi:ParA family protein (plasmid) [Borrelia miyamotoi]|uniref:ParA family protein n=2 Tax=Borrelia miyamotoi TaxID=47466 RepID=A0AAQ3CMU4_9SPIR|nr:ParA family protein [Borrelia miyamotoi]AHH05719.1 Atpase, para family protein [Borrelia miyamotoi FR64b]ATQ15311.1 ParA family protein [Borrelia miyamotoi]ATQ16494.1 ParA family protein [Borrelia miyamotoi]ATQ17641.1 ParA family protein [Borrelia miyamotoi]ATQ18908.1 ParA family protein [Borrelia miyamotoi]